MADFADNFEDAHDEDQPNPLLPLEDRIWRHPSELDHGVGFALDPIAVRRRWLQTQPTRASAWTAGLVGALLATGLVVVGTHLATALTGNNAALDTQTTASTLASVPTGISPANAGFGNTVAAAIRRTTAVMASVDIQVGTAQEHQLGLVVDAKGMLVIPSLDVMHASSILVTLASGVQYVGQVIGNDQDDGIALIHINGVANIPTTRFGSDTSASPNDLALAITSPEGSTTIGALHSLAHPPTIDGTLVHDAMSTDIGRSSSPLGTPLLNGNGRVIGMVIGSVGRQLVVAPGWAVASSVKTLIADQVLTTATLGITAITNPSSAKNPPGALITSLTTGLPASEAGLHIGNVIVAVNGATITSKTSLDLALRSASSSTQLLLSVTEGSNTRTVIVPAIMSTSDG